MAISKITNADIANRGVKGLPDVPGLTTAEMQRKMEELETDVIIPKVNEVVEAVNDANSNLENINGVKEQTISVTTDGNGQFTLDDFAWYKVIKITPAEATNILITQSWYMYRASNISTGALLTNTEIKISVLYY